MANYQNKNNKYANQLREQIKAKMNSEGILIPEMAERANMAKDKFRNYYNGRNDINSGDLLAVLQVLGYCAEL